MKIIDYNELIKLPKGTIFKYEDDGAIMIFEGDLKSYAYCSHLGCANKYQSRIDKDAIFEVFEKEDINRMIEILNNSLKE